MKLIEDFYHNSPEDTIFPINLRRLIVNAINVNRGSELTDLDPIYIIEKIDKLKDNLKNSCLDDGDFMLEVLLNTYLSVNQNYYSS